jgi:hypothetical protein
MLQQKQFQHHLYNIYAHIATFMGGFWKHYSSNRSFVLCNKNCHNSGTFISELHTVFPLYFTGLVLWFPSYFVSLMS